MECGLLKTCFANFAGSRERRVIFKERLKCAAILFCYSKTLARLYAVTLLGQGINQLGSEEWNKPSAPSEQTTILCDLVDAICFRSLPALPSLFFFSSCFVSFFSLFMLTSAKEHFFVFHATCVSLKACVITCAVKSSKNKDKNYSKKRTTLYVSFWI